MFGPYSNVVTSLLFYTILILKEPLPVLLSLFPFLGSKPVVKTKVNKSNRRLASCFARGEARGFDIRLQVPLLEIRLAVFYAILIR